LGFRRDEISLTDHVPIAAHEFEASTRSLDDPECAFVKSLVMKETQQDDVVTHGGASVDPVLDVMTLCSMGRHTAPGEAAEAVPYLDGSAQRCRNRPAGPSHIDRKAIAFRDRHDLAVATDAAGGFARQRRATFHKISAFGFFAGQRADIDVDDDLTGA
jgi:hypothetical protein